MSQGEQRLAELLRAAAPTGQPIPVDDVARRVRRHRRRLAAWSSASVAVVSTAALVLAVTVLAPTSTRRVDRPSGPPSVNLSGTIPWIDAPAGPYTPPKSHQRLPAADARPCTAGDVSASIAELGDGAMSHYLVKVTFRNTGTSSCVLKGYPDRVVATAPGQPPVTGRNGSYFPDNYTANMAPGEVTVLGLETDSVCPARPGGGPAGPAYHQIAISLPKGGGAVTVHQQRGLDLTCGLALTKFSVPDPKPPTEPKDPLDPLRATVEAPPTATAGQVLTYVVTLTNPTSKALRLRPCPSYLEVFESRRAAFKDPHLLNCSTIHSIPAHQRIRYEMRLNVPARARGTARVSWSLSGPNVQADPTTFTVTAAH